MKLIPANKFLYRSVKTKPPKKKLKTKKTKRNKKQKTKKKPHTHKNQPSLYNVMLRKSTGKKIL